MKCPGCQYDHKDFFIVDCPVLWKPQPGETTYSCKKCNKTFNRMTVPGIGEEEETNG